MSAFGVAALIVWCAGTAFAGGDRLMVGAKGGFRCDARTAVAMRELCDPADATARVVIQLDGPMTPKRRKVLEDAGVRLGQYLPENAFVARVHNADDAKLGAIKFIRWQAPYRADWKLDSGVGEKAYETRARREIKQAGDALVTIHLFSDASAQEIAGVQGQVLAMPGGVVHRSEVVDGVTSIVARVPLGGLEPLAENSAVQFVDDVPEITPRRNDAVRGVVQSGDPTMTPVYAQGLRGENQILGIMDGKVEWSHCSFEDAVNPIGPLHRKVLADNSAPAVSDDHGTHVSATAVGDNGVDDDTRGVAYMAKMVFNDEPSFTFAGMTANLDLHHSQGARIHTNSWGNDLTTTYDGLTRAIDAFMHNNEDDLILFAATNQLTLRNPENAKNLLAVGASQRHPDLGSWCSAGEGPTADGRRKPEIYAPGCETMSADNSTPCDVAMATGTSMATPAIAGAAALARQYYTEGWYPTGAAVGGDAFTPSGALLKATLLNGTRDMGSLAGYPGDLEGWGRLVLDDALFFAGDSRALFVDDIRNADGITTGAEVVQPILVNSVGEPLRVTLVWTEPPGAPGALVPTVNNLDLVVTAPDGTTQYLGNVFSGGVSVTGGSADPINNVEQVLIPAPAVGTWTVRILGTAVNEGTQGYALVATGAVSGLPKELSISAIDPPALIGPGVSETFEVVVQPGDESVVAASPKVLYRLDGVSPFTIAALSLVSGNTYEATLPAPVCGDTPEFYVSAEGTVTGEHRAPFDAPAGVFTAMVASPTQTTIFSEDFSSGIPKGWSASGLWGLPGGCQPSPSCDGNPALYYGNTGGGNPCTYTTGATPNSGQLVTATISLPVSDSITLSFCSYLETEQFGGVDEARVLVEGIDVIVPSAFTEGVWETVTGDLTPFAGQNIELTFEFDTVDQINNTFLGWFVDSIEITAETLECEVTACDGDANGDNVVDVNDISYVLFRLGNPCPPCDGDANGDNTIDVNDISYVLFRLGNPC